MHWPPGLCSSWRGFSQATGPGKSVVPSSGKCWVEPGWCRWGSSSQLLAPGQGPPTAAIAELCGIPSPTQSPRLVLRGAVRLLKPGRPCRTDPPYPKPPRDLCSATLSQGQLPTSGPKMWCSRVLGQSQPAPCPVTLTGLHCLSPGERNPVQGRLQRLHSELGTDTGAFGQPGTKQGTHVPNCLGPSVSSPVLGLTSGQTGFPEGVWACRPGLSSREQEPWRVEGP